MSFTIIKDSCVIVYQNNRIGRSNTACTDGTTATTKGKNNRKFESNGCSKVDRPNSCTAKLLRG